METFWSFRLRFRRAYDSAYDSDIRFSLGHKLSYDSDYDSDSDSVASENQPLDLYRVTLCLGSIAFRCSHFKPDTRNSIMETKVPNFVSTMSRTIRCYPCSKLLLTSKGCIYRCFNTQNYIKIQNLSLGFILKIFLKFRKFQPRYSYKI